MNKNRIFLNNLEKTKCFQKFLYLNYVMQIDNISIDNSSSDTTKRQIISIVSITSVEIATQMPQSWSQQRHTTQRRSTDPTLSPACGRGSRRSVGSGCFCCVPTGHCLKKNTTWKIRRERLKQNRRIVHASKYRIDIVYMQVDNTNLKTQKWLQNRLQT